MISTDQFFEALNALLPTTTQTAIAVAVSGGSDSMCLCLLLNDWAQANNSRLVALTVDHQLRADSTEEAARVHESLNNLGIEHHILKWEKDSFPANLQDSARQARYDLLTRWCKSHNISTLAVGHNLEDQVETVMLRLAHHSGPSGLAGIAAKRDIGDITVVRPLLAYSRHQIIETLNHYGQKWIEDPSNQKTIFTRVKIRQLHELWMQHGLTKQKIISLQKKMYERRVSIEQKIQVFYCEHVALHFAGFAEVALSPLKLLDHELLEAIMTDLLVKISGNIYPPRHENILQVLNKLAGNKTFTSHGCLLQPRKDSLLICREAINIKQPVFFHSSKIITWDNRYVITLENSRFMDNLRVEAIGTRWLDFTKNEALMFLPEAVRPTLPGIWQKERLLNIPHLDYYGNLEVRSYCRLLMTLQPYASQIRQEAEH